MIKSAASAVSRETKSRGPRSREAPRPAADRLPSRRPGTCVDIGSLDMKIRVLAPLGLDVIVVNAKKPMLSRLPTV